MVQTGDTQRETAQISHIAPDPNKSTRSARMGKLLGRVGSGRLRHQHYTQGPTAPRCLRDKAARRQSLFSQTHKGLEPLERQGITPRSCLKHKFKVRRCSSQSQAIQAAKREWSHRRRRVARAALHKSCEHLCMFNIICIATVQGDDCAM